MAGINTYMYLELEEVYAKRLSKSFFSCLLCFETFYFKGRVRDQGGQSPREKERDLFLLSDHTTQMATTSSAKSCQSQGLEFPSRFPMVLAGLPVLEPSSIALSRASAGNWMENGAAET